MWIRDVDFPRELLEAHRRGELVIFAGAGVSRDAPSSLPDFRRLTEAVVNETQDTATDEELGSPDVLLGRLERQAVDVHQRVASHIAVPTSSPNLLHEAIIDLAGAKAPVRIVTTNYDLHLSSVLKARGISVPTFAGPALPVGDDFTGIVYLHGNLAQDCSQLIVTDRDFGRAYLTDAWAARFLERMFGKFTVLFVGYSHSDVVMRYLGRALGPTSPRYVLTGDVDTTFWTPLDIHPIVYPVVEGSHTAIIDCVARWAEQSSMGLLDHQQKVAELVSAPPSSVPEEIAYLEEIIADSERVGLFAESAKGEEWLTWASGQSEFQLLFSSMAPTDCTPFLAEWFAREFVAVESISSNAMAVVRDASGRLGSAVWHAIAFHVRRIKPRPAWCNPWLLLLIENAPEYTADALDYALSDSQWPEDREVALLLFDYLTEPHAVADQLHFGGGYPLRLGLRGKPHWLDQSWKQVFQPNLAEAARDVLPIIDRQLRRAHQLQAAAGAASNQWDPLSYSRSAIEPHPQNYVPGSIDVLIDAARDCLEALLHANDPYGLALLGSWPNSDQPLLQRLALHGWSYRSDVDATTKITWLRSVGWLWAHQLRHEVFGLMAVALLGTEVAVADELVADLEQGDDRESDPERRAYSAFNVLSWIALHAPELTRAKEALGRIQADHPEFKIGPHPDLISWHSAGMVASHPPMTPAHLHKRILNGEVSEVIAALRACEDVGLSLDSPSWQDAVNVITQTVRDDPADGLALLADHSSHTPKFICAVIWGWMDADVDDTMVDAIVKRLATFDPTGVVDEVARLLSDGAHGSSGVTAWHRSLAARDLAMELWSHIAPDHPGNIPSGNWLDQAIGHPAGKLALFWVRAIAAEWNGKPEGWGGIADASRKSLESMLNSGDARSSVAEVILVSQLLFFFATDEEWCRYHVLPLLEWDLPDRAKRAWEGYLIWGRWNDKLLDSGLRGKYSATIEHLDDLSDDMHEGFCAHLAGIAVYSQTDPAPLLQAFTRKASVQDRVEWMRQVSLQLDQISTETVENLWSKWMRPYWQGRLESVPLTLTVEESAALALWTVHLSNSIEEGVQLALAHDGAIGDHSNLLRLLDSDRLSKAPIAFAHLVAHHLQGNEPPFFGDHHLHRIVTRLKDTVPVSEVLPIIEQAVRLQIFNATSW